MPSYDLLDFTTVPLAIGKAAVFYGTGAFAGTGTDLELTPLALTEGEIGIEVNDEYSSLTLPEQTGPIPHEKYFAGNGPVVTLPLLAADAALRAITSPTGSASGGYQRRRSVTEYTLVLIPEDVFIEDNAEVTLAYTTAGGWTVGGDAATAAQLALLDLSIFFWRGHFETVLPMYRHEDGGKVVDEATFHAMFNGNMPDGHHVYTVGRPDQSSIEIAAA